MLNKIKLILYKNLNYIFKDLFKKHIIGLFYKNKKKIYKMFYIFILFLCLFYIIISSKYFNDVIIPKIKLRLFIIKSEYNLYYMLTYQYINYVLEHVDKNEPLWYKIYFLIEISLYILYTMFTNVALKTEIGIWFSGTKYGSSLILAGKNSESKIMFTLQYINSLFIDPYFITIPLEFVLEDFIIQIILVSTIFFIGISSSLIRKLWGFILLVLFFGFFLALQGFESFLPFLWLIELTFIIIYLLLILSLNLSIKNSDINLISSKNDITLTSLKGFIIILVLTLLLYLFNINFFNSVDLLNIYNNILNSYCIIFNNYYKENQPNSLILTDLRGIGLYLYNDYPFTFIFFLLLLTFCSIFIILIQIQALIVLSNLKILNIHNLNKKYLKQKINKNFLKKEILEYQLKNKSSIRKLGYKNKTNKF